MNFSTGIDRDSKDSKGTQRGHKNCYKIGFQMEYIYRDTRRSIGSLDGVNNTPEEYKGTPGGVKKGHQSCSIGTPGGVQRVTRVPI